MTHAEAESAGAVERYLLGEMGEEEADGFEQHFFECAVCADEVAAGAIMAENIRALPEPLPNPAAAPEPAAMRMRSAIIQWWRRPSFLAPAFAALALAVTVAYQTGEIARLNEPRPLVAYNLKSAVRGIAVAESIPAEQRNLTIRLDVPDPTYSRYRCELADSAGKRLFLLEIEAPAGSDALSVVVPKGLAPGAYTLKVQGIHASQSGPEMLYRFEAVKR